MSELTNSEKQVVELLIKKGKPMNTIEFCRETGRKYKYANQILWELETRGLLRKTRRIKSNKGFVYYHLNEENEQVKELIK